MFSDQPLASLNCRGFPQSPAVPTYDHHGSCGSLLLAASLAFKSDDELDGEFLFFDKGGSSGGKTAALFLALGVEDSPSIADLVNRLEEAVCLSLFVYFLGEMAGPASSKDKYIKPLFLGSVVSLVKASCPCKPVE